MSIGAAAGAFMVGALALGGCQTLDFGHDPAPKEGNGSIMDPAEARLAEAALRAERERIFRLLEERPDLSVRALREALAAEGRFFGAAGLHRFLKRHGLQRGRRLAWRRKPVPKAAARA